MQNSLIDKFLDNCSDPDLVDYIKELMRLFNLWMKYDDLCKEYRIAKNTLKSYSGIYAKQMAGVNQGKMRSRIVQPELVAKYNALSCYVESMNKFYLPKCSFSNQCQAILLETLQSAAFEKRVRLLVCTLDEETVQLANKNSNICLHDNRENYFTLCSTIVQRIKVADEPGLPNLTPDLDSTPRVEMLLKYEMQQMLFEYQSKTTHFLGQCQKVEIKLTTANQTLKEKLTQWRIINSQQVSFQALLAMQKRNDVAINEQPSHVLTQELSEVNTVCATDADEDQSDNEERIFCCIL